MTEISASEQEGFAVQLPAGMIEEIIEQHMNSKMFKKPVHVLESKASAEGYVFIVEYAPHTVVQRVHTKQSSQFTPPNGVRDTKGRYTAKAVKD